LTKRVELILNQLYEQYCLQYGTLTIGTSFCGDVDANSSIGGASIASNIEETEENYSDFVKSQYKLHMMSKESKENKLEVGKYLVEPCEDDDNSSFDILLWWKTNTTRYPILYSIVRDILAIPISTVASESAFSKGGSILDSFMSFLSPKIVQALVCTPNWLQSSKIISDDKKEMEDTATYEALKKKVRNTILCN
jgi:hAT family C-terminal dimerisation region